MEGEKMVPAQTRKLQQLEKLVPAAGRRAQGPHRVPRKPQSAEVNRDDHRDKGSWAQ
ncbi:MAG: hypothetical protein ACPIOQ_16460 [Promethearchaeia archaeon]